MSKMIPPSELIITPSGHIYHLNLKPENLALTIIAVGDPDRVQQVSKYFDEVELKISKREFVTHTGWYRGKRVTAMSTGMGCDNIEIFLTELDALVNVDFKERKPKKEHTSLNIIRVGTSGSIQEGIPTGHLLVTQYAVGLDSLMAFYSCDYSELEKSISLAVQQSIGIPFLPYCIEGSSKLMKLFGEGLSIGNTVTCPGFYGPQGREVRLKPAIRDMIGKLSKVDIRGLSLTNLEMETSGYYAMGRLLGHEVISLNAIIANRITHEFATDPEFILERLIIHTLEKITESVGL